MGGIRVERQDGIVRVILQSGRGNPLTPQVLTELNDTFAELMAAPPRGVILDADGSKVFSGGFALPIIAYWDRDRIRSFFNDFLQVIHKILLLPCVTVTALEGSAVAAGFIISLATDFRIVKDEGIKMGLPEVNMGVALPAGARVLFGLRTSFQQALQYSLKGELFDPQAAQEIGYATKLSSDPLKDALDFVHYFASKPGNGVGATKTMAGQDLIDAMKKADEAFMEDFLDTWFSEVGQNAVQAQAERLNQSKKS